MKFVQFILRKITKIVATRCHTLRLECIKFDFGWAATQIPLVELTAFPQTPYLNLRGLFLREERRKERRVGGTKMRGERREGNKMGWEGRKGRKEEAFLVMWMKRLSALILLLN